MAPPGYRQTAYRSVYGIHESDLTCNNRLDLCKQTYSDCKLYREYYEKRHNFTEKMMRGDAGYVCLLEKIGEGDLVIMEAGSSSFNFARFLNAI